MNDFIFKIIFIFLIDIRACTIVIILIFSAITLCGVKESATVNVMMFIFHIAVLVILIAWSLVYAINDDFETFKHNMNTNLPDVVSSTGAVLASRNAGLAIFYGYCSALPMVTAIITYINQT
jgi:amino acid transporter